MERRRADGGSGLLARVRWGNVGRLAALLAAALLVLSGPRGCMPAQTPGAVPPVRPVAPPVAHAPQAPRARGPPPPPPGAPPPPPQGGPPAASRILRDTRSDPHAPSRANRASSR